MHAAEQRPSDFALVGAGGYHDQQPPRRARRLGAISLLTSLLETPMHDARIDGTEITDHRTLWTYWAERPMRAFESRCLDNMQRFNPTWRVVSLSSSTAPRLLGRLLPLGFADMAPALQSDCVRLATLRLFGGAWLDASALFTRQHALESLYAEMLAAGKTLRAYTWMLDNIADSWFIMAAPRSVLLSQWHDVFLAYWDGPRTVSQGIEEHSLFAAIRGWEATREIARFELLDYLSIHACFLRVQALTEWAGGRWRNEVMLEERAEATGYYVASLCTDDPCTASEEWMCFHTQCMHDAFWNVSTNATSLRAVSAATPVLKFNHHHRKVIDVLRDRHFLSLFAEPSVHHQSLLRDLLTPPPRDAPDAPPALPPPSLPIRPPPPPPLVPPATTAIVGQAPSLHGQAASHVSSTSTFGAGLAVGFGTASLLWLLLLGSLMWFWSSRRLGRLIPAVESLADASEDVPGPDTRRRKFTRLEAQQALDVELNDPL